MDCTILVVDDEARIRSSLGAVLRDEGFRVLETGEAGRVLDICRRERPQLILLDVWMPEVDGIELLRQIRAEMPEIAVVMISGHGNIQTAVAATRLGAADFIEKPFSTDSLLHTIGRALKGAAGDAGGAESGPGIGPQAGRERNSGLAARPQRTLARSTVAGGHGLHSGLGTGVILHPAPPDTGIVFVPLSADVTIPARLEFVADTGYNTTLARNGHHVRTIEHLMSALHAFGITNLVVKTHGEVPALDGSALELARLIEQAGVRDQAATVAPLTVEEAVEIGRPDEGEFLRIEPAERLVIDYTLEYPAPVGVQQVRFELTSPEAYVAEIAPARTFGFVSELKRLAAMGLARGGRLDNCILVGEDRILNTALRFPDEFARHKILDLIGDLYLLGRPVLGHVIARRTGHSDNLALMWKIAERMGHAPAASATGRDNAGAG